MKIKVNVSVVKAVLMDMAGFVMVVVALPLVLGFMLVKIVSAFVCDVLHGMVRVLTWMQKKYSEVMFMVMSDGQLRYWNNLIERVS